MLVVYYYYMKLMKIFGDQDSLVPQPLPHFQFACNIESMMVAWGRG